MNRTERLYKLHQLLQSHKPVPMRRLMAILEQCRTTIQADIGYLRDFLGAPIIYVRPLGHHYDPQATTFELPGFWLNEQELQALLATQQLLDGLRPGFLSDLIGPLRKRVQQLLEKSGHSPAAINQRVLSKPIYLRSMTSPDFQKLCGALLARVVIDVAYHGRANDQTSKRRLHPQRLLQYRDNWYLLAWCEQAQSLRTFALERLRIQTIGSDTAQDIPQAELDAHSESGFGIFGGQATRQAQLCFAQPIARWVADEQWHPQQQGEWQGDKWLLTLPYGNSTELEMEILRYCPHVEVLAPLDLKARIGEKLEQSLQKFLD